MGCAKKTVCEQRRDSFFWGFFEELGRECARKVSRGESTPADAVEALKTAQDEMKPLIDRYWGDPAAKGGAV